MPTYEYKVIPAPEKAAKVKGLKGPALFAHALETAMNELGADGWQYLRADTLPHEERAGIASKSTSYRNLLVFQREIPSEGGELAPAAAAPTPLVLDTSDEAESSEEEDENIWEEPETSREAELARALFPNRQR